MARSTSIHTLEEIEQEIVKIRNSEEWKLYKEHHRLLNKRRTYMNQLRYEQRKGRELMDKGYTLENIEEKLSEEELELLEEMEP